MPQSDEPYAATTQRAQTIEELEAENRRLERKIEHLRSEAELRDIELDNLRERIHDLENGD